MGKLRVFMSSAAITDDRWEMAFGKKNQADEQPEPRCQCELHAQHGGVCDDCGLPVIGIPIPVYGPLTGKPVPQKRRRKTA